MEKRCDAVMGTSHQYTVTTENPTKRRVLLAIAPLQHASSPRLPPPALSSLR